MSTCPLLIFFLPLTSLLIPPFVRTSYDSSTKQHWLSVSRQKLHGRFLLKGARSSDSTNASTYTTASSEQAEERVKNSVNQLIVALSEMETSRH